MSRIPKRLTLFFEASYRGYDTLSAESRERTSRAAWIALKLGVSEQVAQGYIDTFEATKESANAD